VRILRWIILATIVLQIPFIYSLFGTYRTQRYLDSLERVKHPAAPFQDIRGGIHVHSAQGGHSLGTYEDMFEDAKKAGYRFLFITEHPRPQRLFERIRDPRLVVIYGYEERGEGAHFLVNETRDVRLLTDRRGPIPRDATGVEVFNLHESAASLDSWYNRALFLYHQLAFEDLFVLRLWEINRDHLAAWDQALLERRMVTGVGGCDAHQNIGLILQTSAGQRIFAVLVDPYEDSFRAVSTHVVLNSTDEVSERSILDALRSGAAYVAFERIADSSGFTFHAESNGRDHRMGSTVSTGSDLICRTPIRSDIVVYRDGRVYRRETGARLELRTTDKGVYRVEVYPIDPPALLAGKPWIISNPIFVGNTDRHGPKRMATDE